MAAPRLVSLELDGFKSFANRIELAFPAAITAIIGPNGSGKSNICDAIAWVLGEQSARLLRSQTMSDVIFAGSPNRDPAGTARVSLTLAADDGRWGAAEGRLEITRRVMRDGTSDYRLSGRRARLKDIVDELIDAGMGTRAYAIIEQGRIGQVLSVRATERRALFEEAAGITKYRVRRHEAELKLAQTRTNLDRVADIAGEVRRQLEAARRQARRAERHRELRHELGAVRAVLFAVRLAAVQQTLAERRATLADRERSEAEAAAALAVVESRLVDLERELDELQHTLAESRGQLATVDAEAARQEAEEAAARREREDALTRSEQADEEARRLAKLIAQQAALEADLEARAAAAADAAAEQEHDAEAARAVAQQADAGSRALSGEAEQARQRLLAATASANDARNRGHRLEIEVDQNAYQQERIRAERSRLGEHLEDASRREQAAAQAEAGARTAAEASEETRATLRREHEALTARRAELASERDRAGHEQWQARHEREGLARQIASARALPQALGRAVSDDELLGTVADFLDPEGNAAALLDRAYGDLLTLPVIAASSDLARLHEAGRDAAGRVEVVIADRTAAPRTSPLLARCRVRDDDLGWLSRALPEAIEADSEEDAARLAAEHPDAVILAPDGTVWRGVRIEVPSRSHRAPGALELRRREREAGKREQEAQAREQELSGQLETTATELDGLQKRLNEAAAAAQQASGELAAATSTHEAVHRELSRLQRELDAIAEEGQRLEREHGALVARLEESRREADRLGAGLGAAESQVDAAARNADRARETASAAREEAERRRGLAAVAAERAAAAATELQRHRASLDDLAQRRRAAERETDEQRERSNQAESRAQLCRDALSELLARGAVLRREVEIRGQREGELRGRVGDARTAAERHRAAHLTARDNAHAARLAIAGAEGELERLRETIALTIGPDAELPEEQPDPAGLPALEERAARLDADLAALGPVNELAVSERDELEERHTFLKTQRRDLESSLESLTQTISELDETCAERFVRVIDEVNGIFPGVFRHLFGGGDATVELSEPDNPLESGVEIRVKPPGKHTQSVLLLSGGEKALAAVSLLLSLFRIRPAPFCVLDEVDAPLDDANVERLCRLLREMSGDTQFLLITHNRRTMAHADVLYGVTMEEPGVSRIVSVRMED